MIWMKVASEESGFPPLFLQSIFPHVIGLKSAFVVGLSPVMQQIDMEASRDATATYLAVG